MVKTMMAINIKRFRTERRWTQPQLADKIGVSSQTISNWETGLKIPRMGSLEKLATVFNVTVDDLTSDEKKELRTADLKDNDVIFTYGGKPLSEEDRELIRRLMNGK